MKEHRRSFGHSVRHAAEGVRATVAAERNMVYQLSIAFFVLILGAVLQLSAERLALIVLVAAGVLSMEMINTAIETLEDIVEPRYHEAVKRSKDMAAGAVLMMSLGAIVIGALVFFG